MLSDIESWGRYPRSRSEVIALHWQDQYIPFDRMEGTFLPHGMGRSYGDSCLNDGQALLDATPLDRLMAFDRENGRIIAEAGITFDAILQIAVPEGWFLPVTPGTRFVTLGGAIANDVHGKNHHKAGSFGDHVKQFELRRSDGRRLRCSPSDNAEWFHATLGGLGLTGLIQWAEVQLKPIVNSWIDAETIRYGDLNEFCALSAESEPKYEYLVAWVDSLSPKGVGRGLFIRGNHNVDARRSERIAPRPPKIAVPVNLPFKPLNRATLKVFNTAYYWGRLARHSYAIVDLQPFFYPLDAIGFWNRIYGAGGLIQWQALIPMKCKEVGQEVLKQAARSGSGSFLTVMKVMGERAPAGLLSFAGRGLTIALDFPYDAGLLKLLSRLDAMVTEAGGRLYPAKDARMSREAFRRSYPEWERFRPYVDPRFSSSFWRRVAA